MANVQLSSRGAVIKAAYEGQPNTNAFTDAQETKLASIVRFNSGVPLNSITPAFAQQLCVDTTSDDLWIAEGTTAATWTLVSRFQTPEEVEAAFSQVVFLVSQAEAEAGLQTIIRQWTAQRVRQAALAAVLSLGPTGGVTPAQYRVLKGARTTYNLASGAGALSLAQPSIDVFGTAAGSFDLTLPNGTTDDEQVTILTSGTYGPTNVVRAINQAAAVVIARLRKGHRYRLRWRAATTTWDIEEVTCDGEVCVTGSGTPNGVRSPDFVHQLYRDTANNNLYLATTDANSAWILISNTAVATGLTAVVNDPAPLLGGTLDGEGNPIIDYIQPHVAGVSGTLTQAAHGGRPIFITGTVTVPVTNGFSCHIKNKSGANRTVQPASGSLIHEGTTKASISLPSNRSVVVEGDGTDVWVFGALA